jgi:2',3'-cyclic-nucleotide 2'-phosphodiesterase (5'-nucleotidase family)
MKKIICFLLCTFSLASHAKLLHIIHTNDLHSYFEGYVDGRGGYARIKAKIDDLKAEDAKKGIATLILDAGDFSDGTSFYLTNEGANSLQALDILQTEIAVVGNHDFILGGKALANQIRRANVKTKIVSANLMPTAEMGLAGLVHPYADIEKDGLKIRVIGLTTAEPTFQYSMSPGFVNEPIAVGNIQAGMARIEKKDLIIALTHIGSFFDKLLVQSSTDIDLVVGGHDHKRIDQALMVKNRNKKLIPIVQAASHGLVVGSLLIDVKENHQVDVVEYKLIDIASPMEENAQMSQFVADSAHDRNEEFDGRFDEQIGVSEIKLTGYEDGHPVVKNSCWGQNMAKLSADATGSDIGVHLSLFEGVTINPGIITFGNIVDNFPHVSSLGDPGWQIGTIEVNGKALKIIIKAVAAIKGQIGMSFAGVKFTSIGLDNIPYIGGFNWTFNIKVHGKRVVKDQKYTIAMPAEIGNAVRLTLPKKVQAVFPEFKTTDKYYWQEMESYIRKNSPIKCL